MASRLPADGYVISYDYLDAESVDGAPTTAFIGTVEWLTFETVPRLRFAKVWPARAQAVRVLHRLRLHTHGWRVESVRRYHQGQH